MPIDIDKLPKVYKIKRLVDGKFSKGGIVPKFGHKGKIWLGWFDLQGYLRTIYKAGNMHLYDNCVVEKFTVKLLDKFEMQEVFQPIIDTEKAENIFKEDIKKSVERLDEAKELELLRTLKEKYGDREQLYE
jgi:hypothetical protein